MAAIRKRVEAETGIKHLFIVGLLEERDRLVQ
jgi:hypothetical protein